MHGSCFHCHLSFRGSSHSNEKWTTFEDIFPVSKSGGFNELLFWLVYQRVTPKLLPPKNISKLSLGRKRSLKSFPTFKQNSDRKKMTGMIVLFVESWGRMFCKEWWYVFDVFLKNTISQIPVPFLMPENLSKQNKHNVSKTTFLLIQVWN